MNKEQKKEQEMYYFMMDCKLVYAGKPPIHNKDIVLDKECIKVLESIPGWTWDIA